MTDKQSFASRVVAWQKTSGRHDLPWQKTRDPYCRWIAEIMLQQTQVTAVIPYYRRFIAVFPDLKSLAAAEEQEVLRLWAGLGYYSRGRNLLACAKKAAELGGLPDTAEELMKLPGIGRSTAAALISCCWGRPAAIMDGNAKRVFSRFFGLKRTESASAFEKQLWNLAEREKALTDCGVYTQGLMDLGSGVCVRSRPRCGACPLAENCLALKSGHPEEFPGKKNPVKKIRPEREAFFYVLKKKELFGLTRRSGRGVWKGLLCFPESEAETAETGFEALFPGISRMPLLVGGVFRHEFTHYSLLMKFETAEVSPEAEIPGVLWLSEEEVLSEAVPSPVAKFVSGQLVLKKSGS